MLLLAARGFVDATRVSDNWLLVSLMLKGTVPKALLVIKRGYSASFGSLPGVKARTGVRPASTGSQLFSGPDGMFTSRLLRSCSFPALPLYWLVVFFMKTSPAGPLSPLP